MSIQTEITRLESAKADIANAITAKGVTVPDGTSLDGMAALIAQISGEGESMLGNAIFVGDSIGQGYNNNDHSFVDILSDAGIYKSVLKNCVAGETTMQAGYRLGEHMDELYAADIIYIEYCANDIISVSNETYTLNQIVQNASDVIGAIRRLNPKCAIVWMPLSITQTDRLGNTWADGFKAWANAMFPLLASNRVSLIPVFDMLSSGHYTDDGTHPNDAGQQIIAQVVRQTPYGISNYQVTV